MAIIQSRVTHNKRPRLAFITNFDCVIALILSKILSKNKFEDHLLKNQPSLLPSFKRLSLERRGGRREWKRRRYCRERTKDVIMSNQNSAGPKFVHNRYRECQAKLTLSNFECVFASIYKRVCLSVGNGFVKYGEF